MTEPYNSLVLWLLADCLAWWFLVPWMAVRDCLRSDEDA